MLKKIILFVSLLSFFQNLFSQSVKKKEPLLQKALKVDVVNKNIQPKIKKVSFSFEINKEDSPVNQAISKEIKKEFEEKTLHIITKIVGKNTPGLAISFSKNGKTIWEEGFGYADILNKIPVLPQKTLFRIASVSKPISAVGLARLQQENLIDWNQSLYQYVKDFPKKEYDFTLKQLGGHTAGIRAYKGKEVLNNEPLNLEQGLKFFKNDKLEFEPSTKYLYNSFDWNLIGVAMQRALKTPFEVIMQDKVFDPLSLCSLQVDRGFIIENQSIPYYKSNGEFRQTQAVNNFYKTPGGGFLSTSSDILKFGNAILLSDFLTPEIKTEMLDSQTLQDGSLTGYGIGWSSSKDWKNRPYVGHIGNGIGGYAWFYIYPEKKVVISICMNVSDPKIDKELQNLVDVLLDFSDFVE